MTPPGAMYARFEACRRCAYYGGCAEAQKIADESTACPLTPPVWAAYVADQPTLLRSAPIPVIGAATWDELHRYQPVAEESINNAFIAGFGERVSGPRCNCRKDWLAWIKENPVDWKNYFSWTVAAHNAVNVRVIPPKPALTLEEAEAIWSGAAAL